MALLSNSTPMVNGPAAPLDPLDPKHYDMAAALAAGEKPDARGHMTDTYKLPSHITFSDESIHHGKNGNEGGKWEKLPYNSGNPDDPPWMFTPGKTNLQNYSAPALQQYFQQEEPSSLLKLPNASVLGM